MALTPTVGPAFAGPTDPPGGGRGSGSGRAQTEGKASDQSIEAGASRVTKYVVEGAKGGQTGTPEAANFDPPPCWYEPTKTPKQLKALMKEFEPKKRKKKKFNPLDPADPGEMATALEKQAQGQMGSYYQTDKYKNYNLDKQGKGMFWEGVQNPDMKDDPKSLECQEHAIWVPEGEKPDVPNPVTPKVLAEYAYGSLPIPDTDIELNPKGKQTVNLKSWVWLDKAKFKPVKVRAELDVPGLNIWAETTAKPKSLKLEPGTDDATTYPASGECAIKNGQIGEPYKKGAKNSTPPCGLNYLRSTDGRGPFPLKATLTWEISWKGADGTGGDLPDGSYGDTQNVTVKEIQAVVRD
ncbi:hypothetical protein [Streptomyces sp. NPDC048172]|uniref:hypothetical protein n=1 Tax=Streptomyces sp. NPDC048172 TaxID=3365505 RepID=UPI0037237961